MTILTSTRAHPLRLLAAAVAATVMLTGSGRLTTRAQDAPYTLYWPEGRQTLTVRVVGSIETIALESLAGLFGLTFSEDRAAGGLVIGTKGQRIIAVPGQSFVQVGGRVVSLDGALRRDRLNWLAPIDFLPKALGPAVGQPIVLRRASRLVLVGNVRVPEVGGRMERTGAGARLVLTIEPATPHTVAREGARLLVRFEAAAIDFTPLTGLQPEFVVAARASGSTLAVDLGPNTASFQADNDGNLALLVIDLQPPGPPPAAASPPGAAAAGRPLPPPDFGASAMRTVVLDPGHGGEDMGVTGAGGALEKNVTLQVAQRLKSTIEGRLGLRVLLTRDGDQFVPMDRRTALANHNKADLFISLHANASHRPEARGAQVWTLGADAYRDQMTQSSARRRAVPVLGGGTRLIEPVPWDLAQVPFVERSAALGTRLARLLSDHGIPLFNRPVLQGPVRPLVGANMPAVLLELGFLTNVDDERALTDSASQAAIVDAMIALVSEVRQQAASGGRPGGGR